ncbi:MAG: hypothetical protein AAGE84_14050 [Cyanobacteria bacterium P01_G01_bin.39]
MNKLVGVSSTTFDTLVDKYGHEVVSRTFSITSFSDEAVSQRYAEALITKLEFDASYEKAAPKMTGEFVKIHKTRQGVETKVVINFGSPDGGRSDDLCVSILKQDRAERVVYNTREYVILNFKASAEPELDNDVVSGIYPVHAALYLLVRSMPKARSTGELDNLIQSLVSKVFLDTPIQNIVNNKSFYGRRNEEIEGQRLDQQVIIETHKVNSIGVNGETRTFCKCETTGREIVEAAAFFAGISEPFFTDKNNKKYVVYGDGCRAAGVDLVDGKLVTLNPVDLNKAAKILNRMASFSFSKANSAVISVDGEEGETYLSNLQFALSGGKTVRAAGVEVPVFVSFGAFGLNNGIMETNASRDVHFKFEQSKSLTPVCVDMYSFSEEYLCSLGKTPEEQLNSLLSEIKSFIIEWRKANKVIAAHQVVKFNGVPVIANHNHFPVYLYNEVKDKGVTVHKGGHDFNHQVRSVVVKVTGVVASVKKSPKVRGLTKKATAYPTGTVILKDGVESDWVAILNRECIKGSAALIDIFANDDDNRDKDVIWNKGVLTVDGNSVNSQDLVEWMNSKAEVYVIERQVSDFVEQELSHLSGVEFFTRNGKHYVREEVKGFYGYSMMEVEVSTADENHGISYLGLNEQQMIALAGEKVGVALASLAGKQLDNADLLIGNKEVPVFKLPMEAEALRSFMDVNAEFRTKQWMGAMAKKSLHGIRVEWDFAKRDGSIHTWAANLPFGVFLKFGSWDVAGNPAANISPVISYVEDEDAEVVSSNVLEDVFNFINIVTSDNLSDLERKSLFLRSNVFSTWINNLRSAKKANQFTKASVAFHQKVVGDLTIGNDEKTGLPIVKVSPSNPMLKDKKLSALVKKGEAVVKAEGTLAANRIAFLSRCPLPLFTAVVIKLDDSLDNSVIAVNPLVWIKSNLGDFDGDLGYLTDAAQFGFNSPAKAREFNAKFSAMPHHWTEFKQGKGISPVEDALAVDASVIGAAKSANSLMEEWAAINNEISVDSFVKLAQDVHSHYKYKVGSLYNNSSAFTQELGNKAFNKGVGSINPDEVVGLINSWFMYEEIGLGGYSESNANKLAEFKEAVDKELANKVERVIHEELSPENLEDIIIGSIFFGGAALISLVNGTKEDLYAPRPNGLRKRSKGREIIEPKFNPLTVKAAALAVKGREVQSGHRDPEGNAAAIIAQATRLIARKSIANNEDKIFNAGIDLTAYSRFGKSISTIAALRSQCKK